MKIESLSSRYRVRRLTQADIDAVYALSAGNPLYYRHCPPPVSRESVEQDMRALPPGKTADDKHYVGYFEGDALVAVMDLIAGYPDRETAFIGLFMLDSAWQGQGRGSAIIGECAAFLREEGFARIRLGYAKGNPQSRAFWEKNGFAPDGTEVAREGCTVVLLQRELR